MWTNWRFFSMSFKGAILLRPTNAPVVSQPVKQYMACKTEQISSPLFSRISLTFRGLFSSMGNNVRFYLVISWKSIKYFLENPKTWGIMRQTMQNRWRQYLENTIKYYLLSVLFDQNSVLALLELKNQSAATLSLVQNGERYRQKYHVSPPWIWVLAILHI